MTRAAAIELAGDAGRRAGFSLRGLAHARAIAALVAGFALCELAIWPTADVPLIDDWTYAWSVAHLLETGGLEILPISAVYPITQIAWGALFCVPFGFSFVALRISTVVLAAIGSCALYLTLSELGISRARALLGTVCVACNPVSLFLAHSFMTDAPLVALSSCTAYAYVRGLRRRQRGWLWAAVPLSIATLLVRQVGLVLPLAAAMTCTLTRDRALRQHAAVPALVALLAAVVVWASVGSWVGPAAVEGDRLQRLQYVFQLGFGEYAQLTVEMLLMLALMLLPIGLASLRRLSRLQRLALGAAAIAVWPVLASPAAWNPLAPEHAILSHFELGSARNLLAGDAILPAHLRWLPATARLLMFLSLVGLLAALSGGGRAFVERPELRFCVLTVLLHVGVISVLWLYADRYYLALMPALVACVLYALRHAPLSPLVAAGVLALQLGIGVIGTRDALRYNEVSREAYVALVRAGVRPYDIDAGWSWNGWMLYAQQRLPEGVDRERDIPAVTSKAPRPYLFAKAPVAGYRTLSRVHWKGRAWPWPNELLVLQR